MYSGNSARGLFLVKCLILVLFLGLLGCGIPKESSSPKEIPLRWIDSDLVGGLELLISTSFLSSFSSQYNDASGDDPIEQMMKEWNNSTTNYTFYKVPASSVSNLSGNLQDYIDDSNLGIYQSSTWFDSIGSLTLAVTQYAGVRSNIGTSLEFIRLFQSDIIINYRDYTFSVDVNNTEDFDLPSVIIHELGHFIGLGHQNDLSIPSVMHPSIGVSSIERTLYSNDISSIQQSYGVTSLLAEDAPLRFDISVHINDLLDQIDRRENKMFYGREVLLMDSDQFQEEKKDGDMVYGSFELRVDGSCWHYQNGSVVGHHSMSIGKLRQ